MEPLKAPEFESEDARTWTSENFNSYESSDKVVSDSEELEEDRHVKPEAEYERNSQDTGLSPASVTIKTEPADKDDHLHDLAGMGDGTVAVPVNLILAAGSSVQMEIDDVDDPLRPVQSGGDEDAGSFEDKMAPSFDLFKLDNSSGTGHAGAMEQDTVSSPEQLFELECNQCQEKLSSSSSLVEHKCIHTGERPFKCDQCPKSYKDTSALNRHKIIHTGERPFQCDKCSKAFPRQFQLTEHRRVHSGEKREKIHKCDECDWAFVTRKDLISHKRIHTGEKPFKCDVCDNAFANRSVLVVHKRIHTGEKPYECQHCRKAFTKKSALTRHLRMHTGERPYTCNQCNTKFTQKSALDQHAQTHLKERDFQCEICGKWFMGIRGFSQHKRIHAREKSEKIDQLLSPSTTLT